MKKNIVIIVLIIFCGLFLLYAFQQKTEANLSKEQAVQLQIEAQNSHEQLAQCKNETALQAEMAMAANIEAQRQKVIVERQNEKAMEANHSTK